MLIFLLLSQSDILDILQTHTVKTNQVFVFRHLAALPVLLWQIVLTLSLLLPAASCQWQWVVGLVTLCGPQLLIFIIQIYILIIS